MKKLIIQINSILIQSFVKFPSLLKKLKMRLAETTLFKKTKRLLSEKLLKVWDNFIKDYSDLINPLFSFSHILKLLLWSGILSKLITSLPFLDITHIVYACAGDYLALLKESYSFFESVTHNLREFFEQIQKNDILGNNRLNEIKQLNNKITEFEHYQESRVSDLKEHINELKKNNSTLKEELVDLANREELRNKELHKQIKITKLETHINLVLTIATAITVIFLFF